MTAYRKVFLAGTIVFTALASTAQAQDISRRSAAWCRWAPTICRHRRRSDQHARAAQRQARDFRRPGRGRERKQLQPTPDTQIGPGNPIDQALA